MKNFKPLILIRKLFHKYLNLDLSNFDEEGRLHISQPYLARLISYQIQQKVNKNVFPGYLNSFAVLTGLFNYIMKKFDDELSPNSLKSASNYLRVQLSDEEFENLTGEFFRNFPDKTFLLHPEKLGSIKEQFESDAFKEAFIRNLILTFLSNQNRAAEDLKFIFDDEDLVHNSKYIHSIKILEQYFDKIRIEPLRNKSLIEFLFEPIQVSPESLEGQLNFIKENWKEIIPDEIFSQILKAIDLIKEDEKIFQTGFGPGETKVPTFSIEELLGFGDKFKGAFYPITPIEEEKFTPDTDWMPEVVLLAKNIYVWLYQLSKKYNRDLKRLDQIPDEELDLLASFGFNALWLIGIWERSPASRKIKQLSGNPEALASAYSIYDYVIASDLGGEEAFQNLNDRCLIRGIRLACDIVPNHMGIYSRWIIEHPDYFIQTDYSPFPAYSFTGPDLSEHPDYQIRIEDKYWTRQDAAVIFQLIENKTGKVRYIYHGNDGTNMPWNDTAQLNLLKPEVREALYQLILNIARKFSIIRLDAAMTLTQKHYQRLWYPVPGLGGAIPSRTDFSMSTEEFLEKYPKEFWREVIDRINIDKPDTLLLAEAFWLMEGYFVRTLGMHRVYNSAFMNMLKNEENAKYRDLITNTLEFNPEILKRYVNFLSNPDEETAINQFGDGDKYFGCCVMMVTMPGLPMFAHGQIEGFREKYGHEFSRAYYDEQPNTYLVERHKREIFPLMKKRYLFSQVKNFELFDFKNEFGEIIENVFAYSNRNENEAALIFYNNSYSTYYGYIDYSHPKNYGSSESESDKKLISKSLGEALGLKNSEKHFYVFRETRTGFEFIRKGSDFFNEKSYVELKGYEYKVFLDFVELYDYNGELDQFYNSIPVTGVSSIRNELMKFQFSKVVNEVSKILNESFFINSLKDVENSENFVNHYRDLLRSLSIKLKFDRILIELNTLNFYNPFHVLQSFLTRLRRRKSIPKWLENLLLTDFNEKILLVDFRNLFIALFLNELDKYSQLESSARNILTDEMLNQLIDPAERLKVKASQILIKNIESSFNEELSESLVLKRNDLQKILVESLTEKTIQDFININEYEGIFFYSKENFEELLHIISILTLIKQMQRISSFKIKKLKIDDFQKSLKEIADFLKFFKDISEKSEFKFELLKEKLQIIQVSLN